MDSVSDLSRARLREARLRALERGEALTGANTNSNFQPISEPHASERDGTGADFETQHMSERELCPPEIHQRIAAVSEDFESRNCEATSWNCSACTFENPVERLRCDICGTVNTLQEVDGVRPPDPQLRETLIDNDQLFPSLEDLFLHEPDIPEDASGSGDLFFDMMVKFISRGALAGGIFGGGAAMLRGRLSLLL
jgi:hypothetical protein